MSPLVRALLSVARQVRAHRQPVAEFAHVPPRSVLTGGDWRKQVRCSLCGGVLRPEERRPVTRLASGRWNHGTLRAAGCRTKSRAPRGGRTLEHLLSKSLDSI